MNYDEAIKAVDKMGTVCGSGKDEIKKVIAALCDKEVIPVTVLDTQDFYLAWEETMVHLRVKSQEDSRGYVNILHIGTGGSKFNLRAASGVRDDRFHVKGATVMVEPE